MEADMGLLDRLFGGTPPARQPAGDRPSASTDDQAIARYRYLLRTAPPDAVEQAHAEAFAQLTPAQRGEVLQQLAAEVPREERPDEARAMEPRALARLATRAEMRRPGTLERAFGGIGGGGLGMGGLFAGSLLTTIAGTFIGTAIAHQLLQGFDGGAGDAAAAEGDASADQGDAADAGGDYTEADTDAGAGDIGGDDFGGGDFGGGGDFSEL
jgi:hypothetical protein